MPLGYGEVGPLGDVIFFAVTLCKNWLDRRDGGGRGEPTSSVGQSVSLPLLGQNNSAYSRREEEEEEEQDSSKFLPSPERRPPPSFLSLYLCMFWLSGAQKVILDSRFLCR